MVVSAKKTKIAAAIAFALSSPVPYSLEAFADQPGGSDLNFDSNSSWSILPAGQAPARKEVKPRPKPIIWKPIDPQAAGNSGMTRPMMPATPRVTAIIFSVSKKTSEEDKKRISQLDAEMRNCMAAGDNKQAFSIMERALAVFPEEGHLWFNKGVVAESLSRWEEAKNAFEKAATLEPSLKLKCLFEQARITFRLNDTRKASTMLWDLKEKVGLDQALERDVDGLLIEIADDKAIGTPSMLARASSNELFLGSYKAMLLRHIDQAVTLACEYEHRNPSKTDAALWAAQVLCNAGKYSAALPHYKKAEELDPSNPDRLLDVMNCCTQVGLLEEIQAARQRFVARFPDDARTPSISEQITFYADDFQRTRARESQTSMRGLDVQHFSKSCMPLKVYVPDFAQSTENWPVVPDPGVDYIGLVQKAFSDWTEVSGSKVTFQNIGNLDDANISVEWVADSSSMMHSFAAGAAGLVVNARGQRRMRIQIVVPTTRSSNNARMFYEKSAHEIGHCLGLRTHSSTPSDIMYFSEIVSSVPRMLSEEDRDRLNEIYSR